MNDERRPTGFFSAVSLLSGLSLFGFGFVSLLIVAIWFCWLGLFISWALILHGILELVARHRILAKEDEGAVKLIIGNQLALAASISIYALGMMFFQETASSEELMNGELIQQAIGLYPEEISSSVEEIVPFVTTIFYGAVLVIAWLGCGSTAFYYYMKTNAFRR